MNSPRPNDPYINVFLDTQFFDANQLDFFNKTFDVLRLNVAAGHIRVFSTAVTQQEVERHVRERAQKINAKLESIRNDSILRHVTCAPFDSFRVTPTTTDIVDVMLTQLKESWDRLETRTLPISEVDLPSILDDYFAGRPPFGSGRKKSEFPDAVAASALRIWCEAHSQRMHIVSGDSDWESTCEVVLEFSFHREVAEVLEQFPDANISNAIRQWITSNMPAVKEEIADAFMKHKLSHSQRVKRRILNADVTWIRIDDVFVILAENGVATVQVPCKIKYRSRKLRKDAPSILDAATLSDSGATIETISRTKAVAELSVQYDEANVSQCEINNVQIALRRPFGLGFGRN